jgi:hypothetical protein
MKATILNLDTSLRRRLALALAVVTTAILLAAAPGAHATTPKPLLYKDSDGTGVMFITEFAPDTATGGRKISVQLTQNGFTFSGSGFLLRLLDAVPGQPDSADVDLIVFTLRDAFGRAFEFRGRLTFGGIAGGLIGSGRYQQAGTGVDRDVWTLRGQ